MKSLRTSQLIVVLAASLFGVSAFAQDVRWFKGQTHAHTINSDGDELPHRVARWYQDHDYNFLVITDHDTITDVTYLDADKNADNFILIPGEEVTDTKARHVNGINLKRQVKPQHGDGTVENLQRNIDVIRDAGGIAQVNHPNWKHAVKCEEIAALKNPTLLEVLNDDKYNNIVAAGGLPGAEEIWDCVLSKGLLIYAVSTDDTHDYEGEYRADRAYPGRGWIMVRAKELTAAAIVAALQKGDFYATGGLGIMLQDIAITDKTYSIKIAPQSDFTYTTRFIGKDGAILKEEFGLTPSYTFKGDEPYARAKVICSSGDFAMTQPVFLKSKE